MRTCFTYLLVTLLLACPAVCRSTVVMCCPGGEVEACSGEPGQQAPAAPTDAESCICSGTALKAEDPHAQHVLPLCASLLPESFASSVHSILGALALGRLTEDPDDGIQPARLHALLGVFRC